MSSYSTGQMARALPPRGNGLFDERFPLLNRINKGHVDMAVWIIWVAYTTLPTLPMLTVVRYACAAYFTAGLILHPRQLLPAVARGWPVFILPTLMFISALWAPSAGDAMRKSFLFVLTGIIPIFLATRMSARQIIFGYLLVETIGALLSYRWPNYGWGGVATGIYGQKNWLAIHMFFLYLPGMIFLLDKKAHVALRTYGLIAMGLGIGLIWMSRSTTTLLVAIVATMALLGHAYLWEPARRVRHMRTLLVLIVAALGAMGTFILFGLMQFDAVDSVLGAFGKDTTLTGRTYLWDYARHLMKENPMGLGAEGFWRPEVGDSNSITRKFHFISWTRFSFHNAYLEIGVELGYLGMYAAMGVVAWGVFNAVRTWFLNQTHLNAFFLVMAAVTLIRSTAEIDLASQLSPIAILFFIGAIRRDKKQAPVVEAPPQDAPAAPVQPTMYRGRVIRRG